MEYCIEFKVTEIRRVDLKREPTAEEIAMIENGDMYELPEDLVNWDEETTIDADHHYAKVYQSQTC